MEYKSLFFLLLSLFRVSSFKVYRYNVNKINENALSKINNYNENNLNGIFLKTCERLELYCSDDYEINCNDIDLIPDNCISDDSNNPNRVIKYLTLVISGLNSTIIGETEIMFQTKQTISNYLQKKHECEILFRKAITLSKKIRTKYVIPKRSITKTIESFVVNHVSLYFYQNYELIGIVGTGLISKQLNYLLSKRKNPFTKEYYKIIIFSRDPNGVNTDDFKNKLIIDTKFFEYLFPYLNVIILATPVNSNICSNELLESSKFDSKFIIDTSVRDKKTNFYHNILDINEINILTNQNKLQNENLKSKIIDEINIFYDNQKCP